MPVVYACIAPHSGHLLLPEGAPTPVPKTRAAMRLIEADMQAARPETVVVLTPHGLYVPGKISLSIAEACRGELDGTVVSAPTDLALASTWAYRAAERGIPLAPLMGEDTDAPFPLDWGVVIPYALSASHIAPLPALVVACPGRELSRAQLVDWGETLVQAADETGTRVALVASADQGHGHAADGPYGFTPISAQYDRDMADAVRDDDLLRLLSWPEDYAETALADSYWQTLAIIGAQKRVPLKGRFLSYEVDHYFGLICASYTL